MKLLSVIIKVLILIGKPAVAAGRLIIKALIIVGESCKRMTMFLFSGRYAKRYAFLCLVMMGLIWGSYQFYLNIFADLPDINQIYNPPKLSTKILDRNGKLLYKFYKDENRSWTPIEKIPQSLIWATIAIEDKDFYSHHGLSIKGIAKAMLFDFRRETNDKLRGGSTITQQLVKNVFFTGEQTWKRKIKEAVVAIMIESRLSKDDILERYFNQVSYGGETYGAQEAALKYFGKNVWEINMEEAAFLAGLPAAPSSYSPNGANGEYAVERQHHVIDEMAIAGFITKDKAEELKSKKIETVNIYKDLSAPHFVFFVKDYLEKKYGYNDFSRLGLTIKTSLDSEIQKTAQTIVKEEIEKVKPLHITNGGALVVDVKSGDILAMVGSKDYNATDIDGKYNITTALRQPGSSIKPINYLLALKKGWSMSSVIDDSPVSYTIKGQKPYSPQNYNGKFMGPVTLRTALASSLNVPSVKLLADNGVENMIDLAQLMGITTWNDRQRFGLSLALGSGEVRMTDISQAYSIFANMGKKIEIDPILQIDNYLNKGVYSKKIEAKETVEPKYAFLINNTLSDNEARTPIFGTNSKLVIEGKTVAVKTGTTNNLKDNWCIGWTPSYLVAVWVGNNDSSPMSWVASGVTGATPIWNRIMNELLANKPDEKWETPTGIYKANVCGKEDYFTDGTELNIRCTPPSLISPTPTP